MHACMFDVTIMGDVANITMVDCQFSQYSAHVQVNVALNFEPMLS